MIGVWGSQGLSTDLSFSAHHRTNPIWVKGLVGFRVNNATFDIPTALPVSFLFGFYCRWGKPSHFIPFHRIQRKTPRDSARQERLQRQKRKPWNRIWMEIPRGAANRTVLYIGFVIGVRYDIYIYIHNMIYMYI